MNRVPGVWTSLVGLAAPAAIVISLMTLGPEIELPSGMSVLLVLGLLLGAPIVTKWWMLRRGAAIVNATTRAAARPRWFSSVMTVGVVLALFAVDHRPTQLVLVVGLFAHTVWKTPAYAAFMAAAIGLTGGDMILLAAPVVIMLGRRDNRLRMRLTRSISRTAHTVVYAIVAFLATLPFAAMTAGGATSGQGARPIDSSGTLARLVRWIFTIDGTGSDPGRIIRVPETAAPPPDDDPKLWPWILAAIAIVALIGALAWWWKRRARRPAAVQASARPLARLEAIGVAVGRKRAPHEGAIAYAEALVHRTGDNRIGGTGGLVSGQLFHSDRVEAQVVDRHLRDLESAPPEVPKPTWGERFTRATRWPHTHWRGVSATIVGLAALAGGGWYVLPHLGSFDDPPSSLGYVEGVADRPDALDELLALAGDEVTEWQACISVSEERLTTSIAGVSANGQPLGATLRIDHYDGVIETPASLHVGDDSRSWQIPMEVTATGASPRGDQWIESGWPSVPLEPFTTTASVLDSLGAREVVATEGVDRFGRTFVRHESLPAVVEDLYRDGPRRLTPNFGSPSVELMRTIDVWTDGAGMVERVRVMTDGPQAQWREWRRLAQAPGGAELGVPDCPRFHPPGGDEWVGIAAWAPTRPAPRQIAFDGDGVPYDSNAWDFARSTPVDTAPVGVIEGAIDDRLGIAGYEVLHASDWDVPIVSTVVDWPNGAELSVFESNGWPVASRIDGRGVGGVDEWVTAGEVEIYESFVAVMLQPDLGVLAWEDLEPLLEPLWRGDAMTSLDVDGDGSDETVLLTQSDASVVVHGLDARGRVVAVLVWDSYVPWRRLGIEGRAPTSVLEREDQLRACLDGDRPFESNGRCRLDD